MHSLIVLALIACTDDDVGGHPLGDSTPVDDTGATTAAVAQEGCEDRHQDFIDALQDDLEASEAPGVSAAIMEGGLVTCRVALGTKDPTTGEPAGIDTLFQLGSTTKMFTSVAMLQAVQRGALTLDDTLAQAYPDSEFALDADWNDAVSLQHLLTHQGAFYDGYDWTASSADEDLADWHRDVFFPEFWLMADPGSFFNYSNPNFSLAGLVVEHHDETGRYFPDIMAQDVFGPLGMDRTFMRRAEAVADGDYALSWGYVITPQGTADWGYVAIDDVLDLASMRPAGSGTWSTPTQVLQMGRFLMDGDSSVLADDLRLAMSTPQVSRGFGEGLGDYGYGLFLSPGFNLGDYYAEPFWDHAGGTTSYSSLFWMVPGSGFAVSILSSAWGTDFSGAAVTALSDFVTLPEPSEGPTLDFDPDRLDLHVGTYQDHLLGDLEISRADDGLQISIPFLESLGYVVQEDLVPLGSDLWYVYIDGSPTDLTFLGSEGEQPTQWVRNRSFVGTRVLGDRALSDRVEAAFAQPDRASLRRVLDRSRARQSPLLVPHEPELVGPHIR